jgi:hypothetical protein
VKTKQRLLVSVVLSAVLLAPLRSPAADAALTPAQIQQRTVERRAVEAAIWGIPAVNTELMFQALKRDAKGDVNQTVVR